jgi:membrane associated rhomboid family serine protease
MIALWVFGTIAERAMGTWRFVTGYFIAGAVGAFCYAVVVPNSTKPLAGASLAIAGIGGAYTARLWSQNSSHRLLVMACEFAAIAGVLTWLAFRAVPAAPDVFCSAMYHFIPFLAMWLGVRVYGGTVKLFRSMPLPRGDN